MRSTKSLAHWMAAAIVMIAAYVLSPGAALAHAGHAHAGHAHAAAVSISASDTPQASGQRQIEASSPEASDESPVQSAGQAIPDGDSQAPCTDSCCLTAGASCCGAAVACGPPGSAAGLVASQRFVPLQDSVPAGLSAQALQEPPRVQL